MNRIKGLWALGLATSWAISGCGPDVITAAGTSATAAAAAAQQGKEEKATVDARIKAMQEASQKHQDALEQVDKGSQ